MRIGSGSVRFAAVASTVLALAGSLLIAGCTSNGETAPVPTDSRSGSAGAQHLPFAGPGADAARSLTSYAVVEGGPEPLRASWFGVSGLSTLNAQVEKTLLSAFAGYLGPSARFQPALYQPRYLPQAAAYLKPGPPDPRYAGLQVHAQIPVASGRYLLTRIDAATIAAGRPTGFRTRAFITDTAANRTLPARALLNLSAARASIRQALLRDGYLPAQGASTLALPDDLLDDVDFAHDGSPVLHLPRCVVDAAKPAVPASPAASAAPPATSVTPPATSATPPAYDLRGTAVLPLKESDLSALGHSVQDSLSAAWTYPAVRRSPANDFSCALLPCVALSYDDGPGPYTDRLLGELAAENVHATFFEIGRNVAAHPAISRRVAAAGHVVGSHTWDHPELPHLPAAAIRSQMDRSEAALTAAGVPYSGLMRPPYGAVNSLVRKNVKPAMVLWDVDTLDWQNKDAAKTTQNVMARTQPGSIVLMHDVHPTSVDAAPGIIDQLRSRGYYFVTVPDLFHGIPLRQGQTYRCRSTRAGCQDR